MRTRQWHRINIFHRCGVFTIIMCYVMDFVLCNFMLICHVQVNTLCRFLIVVWFAFSIAAALQLPCIILNTNKNRKQGKTWE